MPLAPQFPKRCNCCRAMHSAAAWAALPRKPDQVVGEPGVDLLILEQRDCPCGSTLAVVVRDDERAPEPKVQMRAPLFAAWLALGGVC